MSRRRMIFSAGALKGGGVGGPASPLRRWPLGLRSGVAVRGITPLLDARAAGRLLGVPHTWLLAQARAGRIPHHRLGHYVRFSAEDLREWLVENRIEPDPLADRRGRVSS